MTFATSLIKYLPYCFVRSMHRHEYKRQAPMPPNERAVEYRFVFEQLAKYCPAAVLDVGTGGTALPSLMRTAGFMVTPSDSYSRNYWPTGIWNWHCYVESDDICSSKFPPESFDFITCVSTLEHIPTHAEAVRGMFRLLRRSGKIVITCPYHEHRYVPNVYDLPGSTAPRDLPFVTQCFSRNEVDAWLKENNARIVSQEYWKFFTGEFWTVGDRVIPPVSVSAREPHQITCLVLEHLA